MAQSCSWHSPSGRCLGNWLRCQAWLVASRQRAGRSGASERASSMRARAKSACSHILTGQCLLCAQAVHAALRSGAGLVEHHTVRPWSAPFEHVSSGNQNASFAGLPVAVVSAVALPADRAQGQVSHQHGHDDQKHRVTVDLPQQSAANHHGGADHNPTENTGTTCDRLCVQARHYRFVPAPAARQCRQDGFPDNPRSTRMRRRPTSTFRVCRPVTVVAMGRLGSGGISPDSADFVAWCLIPLNDLAIGRNAFAGPDVPGRLVWAYFIQA